MTDRDPSLLAAEDRASAARQQLSASVGDVFGWFSPDRLKAEAAIAATQQIDDAKAALRRSVNRHPLATWSAFSLLAAAIAYILRRPAVALTRTGIDAVRAARHRFLRRKT